MLVVLMSRTLSVVVLVAVVAAAAVGYVLYGNRSAAVHAPATPPQSLARLVPVKAPAAVAAVAFTGADGKRHALSEFKGHYVLLNLWAVWCVPCVKELPALAKLQAGAPGLTVVPVDVARGTPADAAAFLKEHGAASLPAYIDTDLALMRTFGAYGLPLTILIDDKGREVARAVGPADWDAPDAVDYFKALTAKS
jgi:thiol-disulfide isomerase/thioredoxin